MAPLNSFLKCMKYSYIGLVKLFAACRSIDNPFQKCLPATQIDNPASLNYSLWVGNGITQLIEIREITLRDSLQKFITLHKARLVYF